MVSDIGKSVDFYTNILELDLLKRYDNHYAEVQAPDLLIGLHPRLDKSKSGTNMSIGLGVGEFDESIKSLESKEIALRIEEDGRIRLAHFTDPDGNQLFLAENKE